MCFILVLHGFVAVRRFARRMLAARQNLEKTVFSDSKTVAQGIPGNLGRASLSAKIAKSSKKALEVPPGPPKFFSQRKRGNFERETAPRSLQGARGPPTPRRLILEFSNGYGCVWKSFAKTFRSLRLCVRAFEDFLKVYVAAIA